MNQKIPIMEDKNQQPFDIPVSGNLGLLALGYTGLVAWRKKKKEVRKQKMQERKQNEG